MKKHLTGTLAVILVISVALNIFMFIQLHEKSRNNSKEQKIDNNTFNTDLIGVWKRGEHWEFHVQEDGIAYLVYYSVNEDTKERLVFSLEYGYMDLSSFVATKIYESNLDDAGFNDVYRQSVDDIIENCLRDNGVKVYRVVLEGNTITQFGDTRLKYIRDNSN